MLLWFNFSLLLLLLCGSLKASKDYRHITYDNLTEKIVFQQENVTTYSQLLFDVDRHQVIVGARNNLYRLTLDTLSLLEHVFWPSKKDKFKMCDFKGKSEEDCQNYVKVLLRNNTRLLTCGTNAFSPICSWREIDEITNEISLIRGEGICPFSPHSNSTSLLASSSGDIYSGNSANFHGNDHIIYSNQIFPYIRTRQYDSEWLNEPQFVGSFETKDYVYFLFREVALECTDCSNRVYSRIGRVCKYDVGNDLDLKNTWTTFNKARLNCSLPGEHLFYYDEIQSAVYQPEQNIVYATLTTSRNATTGSAICAFNYSAILAAFDGPFKQKNTDPDWKKKSLTFPRRQCKKPTNTESISTRDDSKYKSVNQLYPLMDNAVQGITQSPLYSVELERLTHLAVDVTTMKFNKSVTVLYAATSENLIKKITILPKTLTTCVVQIWGPVSSTKIMTMQYLKETKSLYIGTQNAVLKIPTTQCSRHMTPQSCLDAQDPYCGLDDHLSKCNEATITNLAMSHWHQKPIGCPEIKRTTYHEERHDGWSDWGPWFSCPGGNEPNGTCLCQMRSCDNSELRNSGQGCIGSTVRVINCTQHT